MPLHHAAAIAAGTVLAGLAVFQILLISGMPWGRLAWGGQHRVLPRGLKISSAVSILLYAVFGSAAVAKAGLVPSFVNDTVLGPAMWALTAYFALGIVLNGISRSKPERLVMTPVALLLAVLYLVLSLS